MIEKNKINEFKLLLDKYIKKDPTRGIVPEECAAQTTNRQKNRSVRTLFGGRSGISASDRLAVHRAAAVDDLTADIRREIRGEEQRHLGHVLGRAAATQRNLLVPLLLDRIGQLVRHVGDDGQDGAGSPGQCQPPGEL